MTLQIASPILPPAPREWNEGSESDFRAVLGEWMAEVTQALQQSQTLGEGGNTMIVYSKDEVDTLLGSYATLASMSDYATVDSLSGYVTLAGLVDYAKQSWVNSQGFAKTLAGLSDVDLTGLADGNVLVWNATSEAWEPSAAGGGSGTVTEVTVGTGLAVATGTTTPAVSLSLDALAEKTGALVGTDRLVGLSGTTHFSETISAIPLSIFSNDAGFITSLAGYATESYVEQALSNESDQIQNWVTTNYATITYVDLSTTDMATQTWVAAQGFLTSLDLADYATQAWVLSQGYLSTVALNGLSDVTITTPSTDQVLKYNGSAWVNAAAPGGASAINDLSDVTITTPSNGEVLQYNGSAWVNAAGGGGVSLANGVDNRLVTASSASALNGEAGLTFDGTTLDIGAGSQSGANASATFPFTVTKTLDSMMALELHNASTGTAADTRFFVADTTAHYLAFSMPGTGNTSSNLFGIARSSGAFIFSNGGTLRDIAIGTLGAKSLILGTNNTARLSISSAGVVDISGSLTLGTALAEAQGGTGQSTYATGDLLYASAANTLSKLAAGTNGHVLTLSGGVPTWAAAPGGSSTLAALTDVTITSAASGDVLRHNGTAWVDAVLTHADISDFDSEVNTLIDARLDTTQTITGAWTINADWSLSSGKTLTVNGTITIAGTLQSSTGSRPYAPVIIQSGGVPPTTNVADGMIYLEY